MWEEDLEFENNPSKLKWALSLVVSFSLGMLVCWLAVMPSEPLEISMSPPQMVVPVVPLPPPPQKPKSQEALESFQAGRAVFIDLQQTLQSFFQKPATLVGLLQMLTQDYVQTGSFQNIPSSHLPENRAQFQQSWLQWLSRQTEESLTHLAHFIGFHLPEESYHIPLSAMASSMLTELEEIHASSEKKTMLQLFFTKQPQKVTKHMMLFLRAYLAYDESWESP